MVGPRACPIVQPAHRHRIGGGGGPNERHDREPGRRVRHRRRISTWIGCSRSRTRTSSHSACPTSIISRRPCRPSRPAFHYWLRNPSSSTSRSPNACWRKPTSVRCSLRSTSTTVMRSRSIRARAVDREWGAGRDRLRHLEIRRRGRDERAPQANLIETQCHGFDMLEHLCGPIESVMAQMVDNLTGRGNSTMAIVSELRQRGGRKSGR